MTDAVMLQGDQPDWRNRTLILALVGAVAAWLVWWIMDLNAPWSGRELDPSVLARRAAMATGIAVAAIAFGFGLERIRIRWTIGFALGLGLVAGLILWWNNDGHGIWNWSGASLFLAIAIAVPLFQVARDEGRLSFPYSQIHGHAWTNVVLWFACWAFAGVSMLLTVLMSELFQLIGIKFLHDLLEKGWFPALVIGGAFGAALGLFRDREAVVRLLQRVVTSVLSVLAPILGAGLLIFLLSLPFTGLNPLWEATRNTTPILLTCVIGALILTNAVLGHGPEDEATSPIIRWGAMALGLAMLPLAVVAAIATGLRIQQYGFTPDRLWALVFVILTTAYGLVYLIALLRKRQNWAVQVRPDNIRLAFATMAVGLLLATPLVGFNSISTNSQVTRLATGKVSPDKFDWAALAFDFGQPGRDALKKLTASGNAAIRALAVTTSKAERRYDLGLPEERAVDLDKTLRVLPVGSEFPADLRQLIAARDQCGYDNQRCTLVFLKGGHEAILLQESCFVRPIEGPNSGSADSKPVFEPVPDCRPGERALFVGSDGQWKYASGSDFSPGDAASKAKMADGYKKGQIEVRTVERRQLVVGGVPVGDAFE